MPKFDVILMNPPYDKDLHLQFFNKSLDMLSESGSMCIVEPGQWLVQLKDNSKYTKQDSLSEEIKKKIDGHVSHVELNNLNKEFNIANKTVLSITAVDLSKDYQTIELERCGEISQVNSIYDCNLIGDYNIVKSILNKCKAYKDHMINHCINTRKYKEYEKPGRYFLRYGNYMLDTVGAISGNTRSSVEGMKCFVNGIFRPYLIVAAEDKPIESKVPLSKSGNPCDSVYGTKKELENWKYLVEHNNIVVFVNICLTIDEHNNSREYLPWLVDKKYTDEEIYKLLNINEEEQQLISSVIKKFDRNSQFAKNYFGV